MLHNLSVVEDSDTRAVLCMLNIATKLEHTELVLGAEEAVDLANSPAIDIRAEFV